jgi:hypothetical protein
MQQAGPETRNCEERDGPQRAAAAAWEPTGHGYFAVARRIIVRSLDPVGGRDSRDSPQARAHGGHENGTWRHCGRRVLKGPLFDSDRRLASNSTGQRGLSSIVRLVPTAAPELGGREVRQRNFVNGSDRLAKKLGGAFWPQQRKPLIRGMPNAGSTESTNAVPLSTGGQRLQRFVATRLMGHVIVVCANDKLVTEMPDVTAN